MKAGRIDTRAASVYYFKSMTLNLAENDLSARRNLAKTVKDPILEPNVEGNGDDGDEDANSHFKAVEIKAVVGDDAGEERLPAVGGVVTDHHIGTKHENEGLRRRVEADELVADFIEKSGNVLLLKRDDGHRHGDENERTNHVTRRFKGFLALQIA